MFTFGACLRFRGNVPATPFLLIHQATNRKVVVDPLAAPPGDGSSCVDGDAVNAMPAGEFVCVATRRRCSVESLSPSSSEAQRAVIQHPDIDPPLMHLAMMEPAQHHQVRQLRLAAVGPVADVMAVEETRMRAAGTPAAGIT